MKTHLFASISAQALTASSGGVPNLPVDAKHRYWRFRGVRWGAGAYNGLSGLYLYEGDTNMSPQATITGSRSAQAGSYASIATFVAGSSHLQFGIGENGAVTINFDFGSTPRRVDSVGVYPNKDGAVRSPIAFWIDWSDDNVNWTPKAFVRRSNAGMVIGVEDRYVIPALKPKANVWAIFGWMPSGSMGELEMLSGGVDLTTGQTAFASSNYSAGENAAKAIDDDNNTNWSGRDESNGSTLIGVEFATAVQPAKVAIQTRNDSTFWTQTPWQNIFLGYGDDRITYRVKVELTAGQTVNPYTGAVQKKTYDAPVWTSGP